LFISSVLRACWVLSSQAASDTGTFYQLFDGGTGASGVRLYNRQRKARNLVPRLERLNGASPGRTSAIDHGEQGERRGVTQGPADCARHLLDPTLVIRERRRGAARIHRRLTANVPGARHATRDRTARVRGADDRFGASQAVAATGTWC
jgi:hypothetical protein